MIFRLNVYTLAGVIFPRHYPASWSDVNDPWQFPGDCGSLEPAPPPTCQQYLEASSQSAERLELDKNWG